MNLHGDMIYVCSEQGKGNYFKLSLPVLSSASEAVWIGI